jgi:hypothetical protein
MAFEKCRTWNTGGRLVTWAKNNFNGTEKETATATAKPMNVIKANVPQKTTVAQQKEVLNMLGVLDAI